LIFQGFFTAALTAGLMCHPVAALEVYFILLSIGEIKD
jgi:hypothetical protein